MDDAQALSHGSRVAGGLKISDSRHSFPAKQDVYFSADVETDGPIPGPYSMLSFALVYAGSFDGTNFNPPRGSRSVFYRELRPISDEFQQEALETNGLDRSRLIDCGDPPTLAMSDAADWIRQYSGPGNPVLVAYPLSFDWSWLYWYFVKFSKTGSPFEYSQCFDVKTALAVTLGIPISRAGRSKIPSALASRHQHTHHAVDDAVEQAEIFAKLFELRFKSADDRDA